MKIIIMKNVYNHFVKNLKILITNLMIINFINYFFISDYY